MRNRQMIVRWLMANTKAIRTEVRDGKTYYVMADAKAFRDGVGTLLAEVQRIKAEGDLAAARKLFDTHGIHFDPKLRDQVVARVEALQLPSYSGFVMPRLEAVRDAAGQITDVRISYPQDLTKQMLEFAAATRASRTAFLAAERARH
jgi:dipeptidyl-peptidase-3